MYDRRGLKLRAAVQSPNGENRRKLGALAETPRAYGTKTSWCGLEERTRTMDGDGRWWRTISVTVVVVGRNGGGSARNQRVDHNREERTQSNESRGGARWWLAPLLSFGREDTWMQPRGPVRNTRAGDTHEYSVRVLRTQWQVFANATGLQGSPIRSRGHENNRQPGVHVPETVSNIYNL